MDFLMKSSAVGLEIDNGEARAVELRGHARPALAAWGRVPIPDGAVSDGMVIDQEVVGDVLNELWTRSRLPGKNCILGVSNQSVIVRFATFPKVPDNKLDQLIRYQAQDYIPLPLNSVVLDYTVIGERQGEHSLLVEVLLVAGKRDMLETFIAALASAGLKPLDIDVSSLALLRILPPSAREGTYVVVDIAQGLSNILITSDGRPRFARHVSVGLQGAAAAAGCSLDDLAPASGGVGTFSGRNEGLLQWCDSLAGEINSSLSYAQGQLGDNSVESILLSGRGARLAGLETELQNNLGLGSINLQPFEGIRLPSGSPIKRIAADFAVSTALARRGLEV